MVRTADSKSALVLGLLLWFPGSAWASHSWGYEEVLFLDFIGQWTDADRLDACETYKNELDDPNWGPNCAVGGELTSGHINRGCSNSNPGNKEGGCEAALVFCRLTRCLSHAPHVIVNLGMTAFRCETHGYYYDFTTDTCRIPESNPGKERGLCGLAAGNPCNPVTGNKFQRETDYSGAGPFPLEFQRFYNSVRVELSPAGADWRHSYDRSIHAGPVSLVGSEAKVARPDGKILTYSFLGGVWIGDPDVVERLSELKDSAGIRTGWRIIDANDTVEDYDASGRLVAVTNRDGFKQTLIYEEASGRLQIVIGPFGRALSFTHNANGLLESITDPAGNVYQYVQDDNDNLVAVIYPDETPADDTDNPSRVYHYENAQYPHHLTGISDVSVSGTEVISNRFSTYEFDNEGRAVSSTRAGGANAISITYDSDGTSTVTDALGNQTIYTVESVFGVRKTTAFNQPCALCQNKSAASSYDDNGFLASITDFNGNVTTFQFDDRGLELSRTEAAGTSEARTVTTEWHPTFRRPVKTGEPGRETTFTYDEIGRLLSRTVTDTSTGELRTTRRTYTPEGLLRSIDGPRTDVADVTTFEYDTSGNLISAVNPLGHETRVTEYDAHGRPLSIVDPNGAITQLRYDARGRVVSRDVAGSITRFRYDGVGNVVEITFPDGSFIAQEYDGANRLIGVSDNLGNRVNYTLDALGNRIAEQTFGAGGDLRRSMSRVYNVLNRLVEETGGAGQTGLFAYDAQGNVIATTDPNGRMSASRYDAFHRLIETIAPDDGIIRFAYDVRDNLVSVTDPRMLRTEYRFNGFDEVIERLSPDTGLTAQEYDKAGNRVRVTDARGIDVLLEYDAVDRLTAIRYPDPGEDVIFEYDQGPNGIGRLTRVTDEAGAIELNYDARGNLIAETRVIDGFSYTTGYEYDPADRIMEITYPSGLQVEYQRDVLGRVSSVVADKDGVSRVVATDLEYAPFGPVTGLTFGNGIRMTRTLDHDYRLLFQEADPVQALTYSYDAASNITEIQDGLDSNRNQVFGYDEVNRLTSARGVYGERSYTYDQVGNRLARTAGGEPDSYQYRDTANQLLTVSGPNAETFEYDIAGNTVRKGPMSLKYNDANRLETVQTSGELVSGYKYNAKGERVKKTVAGEVVYFHYDQWGNLLAEFDAEGNPSRDYIWLDGERLAIVTASDGPDLTFSGENRRTGDVITVGIFLEDQTVEVEDAHGLSGTYILAGKQWKVGEDGELKLSFKDEGVHFEASLNVVALDGNFGGRTNGPWHPYQVAGEEGGTDPEGLFFIHTDHLGTPKVATDEDRRVVWEASHTPFGTALISVEDIENNLRFPGQFFDRESGFHYNYHRNYSPTISRYLESDPVGLVDTPHLYVYAGSNPVSSMDPLGLCRIEVRFNMLFLLGNFEPPINVSHAFIVTTNTDGSERYYRGGPSGRGLFGDWGNIQTEAGPYVPGTPDYPSDELPRLTIVDNDKDCSCYDEALEKAMDRIEVLKISYNPAGSNSNTTVANALRSITSSVLPRIPSIISVPGWNITIPGLELEPSECCEY